MSNIIEYCKKEPSACSDPARTYAYKNTTYAYTVIIPSGKKFNLLIGAPTPHQNHHEPACPMDCDELKSPADWIAMSAGWEDFLMLLVGAVPAA